MARHYINFRDKKYLYFHEFRQEWKKQHPDIHLMVCSAEYKQATRIIFKQGDDKLTIYLKDITTEKLTVNQCILLLYYTFVYKSYFDALIDWE